MDEADSCKYLSEKFDIAWTKFLKSEKEKRLVKKENEKKISEDKLDKTSSLEMVCLPYILHLVLIIFLAN